MSEAALQQRELVVRSCVRSPSRSRSASGEKEVEGVQPTEVVSESPAKRARRGSGKREVESDDGLSFSSNSSRVIS